MGKTDVGGGVGDLGVGGVGDGIGVGSGGGATVVGGAAIGTGDGSYAISTLATTKMSSTADTKTALFLRARFLLR